MEACCRTTVCLHGTLIPLSCHPSPSIAQPSPWQEAQEALQALLLLCSNVVAHPDEPRFRAVRVANGHFERTVGRHAGGLEAVLALGFAERESLGESEEAWLVLDEPSLEDDFDLWSSPSIVRCSPT